MRAVVYEDVGRIRVDEVPDPGIEDPGDAIVRVTSAAICGSDLHLVTGKAPLYAGDTVGHEAVGIVETVGPRVERFVPGDRVVLAFNVACGTCWFCLRGQSSLCEDFRNLGAGTFGGGLGGAQAERVRVPFADVNMLRVPGEMSDEGALFVGDVLTTGYYGAAIAGIGPSDTVAVIGAGPVGFFAIQAARTFGAREVLALDVEPDRLALAERVGAVPVDVRARNAQMAVSERTGNRGADIVIECVGSPSAFGSAVEVVRRGGILSIVGMYVTETVEVPLGIYWTRMLTLRFAGICPIHAWWERALEAVRSSRIDPLPIVSHTLPLGDAVEGYRLFEAHEATKVVLKP
jgi:threonine dehydrogenase-like Zn-dependent dehydrogenase